MWDKAERLLAGLDEPQKEALGNLDHLADLLQQVEVPEPGPAERAELLARLGAVQAAQHAAEGLPAHDLRGWFALTWSQTALLEAPFWWAGGLVLACGLALALIERDGLLALAFVLFAPLLSTAGVAYLFRPETRTLRELEKVSPVDPLELLYARLALVLSLGCLLSLALLALVWLHLSQMVLWRLILAWFGPMLALTGVALYTAVRWGAIIGALFPLGLWCGLILLGWRQAVVLATPLQPAADWVLYQINTSNALLLACTLASALGALLFWQAGRFAARDTYVLC